VQVRGLRFRFAANMAQHDAVVLAGAHDLLEDCVIERNLIIGNREGFDFREQERTTRRIGQRGEVQIWNHDELIRHNLLAFNRDAQVWGWFDVKDNRHWPAAMRTGPGIGNADNAPGNDGQKKPEKALRLEDLRLRFENNVYFAAPGQGWFEWGVPWGCHKSYASLSDFQAGLAIDSGGCVADPGFLDILARDYRISRAAMDPLAQVYPQGPVPGVMLGVRPDAP
jgi:hypothetical protein